MAAFPLVLVIAIPQASQAAVPQAPEASGAQGDFRPPVATQNTDETYVSAVGILAVSSPLTFYGAVVGYAHSLGPGPYPLLGFEVTANVLRGGGTFKGLLPSQVGGPDAKLELTQGGGSFTLKCKPVDARANGSAGVLFYGTVSAGLAQTGLTTRLGSAYLNSMLVGANGGVLVEGRLGGYADVMVFAGYRAATFSALGNEDVGTIRVTAPEYGGDLTIHLPHDLSLKLSSVFSTMKQNQGNEGLKIFTLGLTWIPHMGVSPVIDGGKS
jgi:hypothetical protein